LLQSLFNFRKRVFEILDEEGFGALLRRPFSIVKEIFFIRYTLIKIKQIKSISDINKLIEFNFKLNKGFIKPTQHRSEIFNLLSILKKRNPKLLVEIGTASGGTLFLFTRVASADATLISIDLPGGKTGGLSGSGYSKLKIPLFKAFCLPNQKLHLLRVDSHSEKTKNQLKSILKGKKIDFLFIDGDHSYNGVKMDFEMYSPLVQNNGIIAFHDIIPNLPEFSEVDKFWNEIKLQYNYEEFIEYKNNQSGYGIGLLKLSKL